MTAKQKFYEKIGAAATMIRKKDGAYSHKYVDLSCAEDDYALKLKIPRGGPALREMVGYVRNTDDPLPLDDHELDPVQIDQRTLLLVSQLKKYSGRQILFLDGMDMLMVGGSVSYMAPFPVPALHAMGNGHKIAIKGQLGNIIGTLIEAAQEIDLTIRLRAGVPDGETFVFDVIGESSGASDEEGFHFRFEQPVVFAPWMDYMQPLSELMSGTDVIVTALRSSLRHALARSSTMSADRDDPAAKDLSVSELVFEGRQMFVRPMVQTSSDDMGKQFDNVGDSLPVKIDSFGGPNHEVYQFVYTRLLKAALEMFDGDKVHLSTGALIGSPIVLTHEDTRLAIRTGARV